MIRIYAQGLLFWIIPIGRDFSRRAPYFIEKMKAHFVIKPMQVEPITQIMLFGFNVMGWNIHQS